MSEDGHLIIVERPEAWAGLLPEGSLITPRDYLTAADEAAIEADRVISLCRGTRYLGTGYYCSLLAEARGQRVMPEARTILELNRRMLAAIDTSDLDGQIGAALRGRDGDEVGLMLRFGETDDPGLATLALRIFERFPCPLLSVVMKRDRTWRLHSVQAQDPGKLDDAQRASLAEALLRFVVKRPRRRNRSRARYDLAILHDPDEALAPSDDKALKKFIRVGRSMGIAVDLITRRDYSRLVEYDALFIRETTRIDHHTYRFARRAESEGMVVIDDPDSILRCTNKVYLAELLRSKRVPTPRTRVLHRSQLDSVAAEFGFPVVLKIPDGSFSRGVYKADDAQQLQSLAEQVFEDSDLILAQEFMYTDFDWRIGVLDRQPLFACKYFMSERHWQIVNHKSGGGIQEGDYEAVRVEDVPERVMKAALRAARLMGDGLYGVDVKQSGRRVAVIEVNDNPNLEAGVEDAHLKDQLYRSILQSFITRLERKHAGR